MMDQKRHCADFFQRPARAAQPQSPKARNSRDHLFAIASRVTPFENRVTREKTEKRRFFRGSMKSPSAIIVILSFLPLASAFAGSVPGPGKGQRLYEQSGANSCMYCHGIAGNDGKVGVAANLTKPKTWRTYRGLGGDAAFVKNKTEFLAHLTEVLESLIRNGALIHNSIFKAPWFDKAAAGGDYNAQMIGITGSPSQNWIEEYRGAGMDENIASKSVLMYLKTLDTQGVFADLVF